MKNKRIVLKPNVVHSTLMKAVHRNKWMGVKQILRSEDTPYEAIFVTWPDKNTFIHYIEDFVINTSYIIAEGEEVDRVISEAKNSLDCYSWPEILEEYDRAENYSQKIKAIYIAGVAAPYLEYDQECQKFFDRTLLEENSKVRMATILAMGYTSWPEWKEVLRDLHANDPDVEVRQSALAMLESFERVEREQIETEQQSETDTKDEVEEIKTRSIEDLDVDVPVIIDPNSISDSVRIEYKLENGLVKEIYFVAGTDVSADQIEDRIEYLEFVQELAEYLDLARRLEKRIAQWIELHNTASKELDKFSVAKTTQRDIEKMIRFIEELIKRTILVEKLEENANKFNHFGGGATLGVLEYTAKLIQEKVPETIADCMERLDLLEDGQEAFDAVVDLDIEDVFSYFYIDRDFILTELTRIEETLEKIENNPEEGYLLQVQGLSS